MTGELDARVAIVGAGAAGLWAAGVAARRGADVLVLEKTPRTGTKVLASGGTRCNLTTSLGPDEAARLFGPRAERFLRPGFRALPPDEVRARFRALGVETIEHAWDKVFPESGRALDVRDALEREARDAGARIALSSGVQRVFPEGGRWVAELEGARVRCDKLLLCPGGRSYPSTGTVGDGYRWLAELELPLVETVPALVPLTSPAPWVHRLSGIALQDAEVRLHDAAGKVRGRERRPILFTHRGVSGPGPMDLSEWVARADDAERWSLAVDLAPERPWEELRDELVALGSRAGRPALARVLPDVPRRVLDAAARQAGLPDASPPAAELSKKSRHALVEALRGLRIPLDGTLGWDKAEVTAGGLELRAVAPTTCEVRGHPGLYVFGELLDVAGPIGGLNFQAAFATAELAALHASASPTARAGPAR